MFLSIFCLVQIPCELSVIILKEAIHDFLEANNELPEVISLLCDNNCLFDLALLDDVNNHLNHLNMKLQDMNKLFPNLLENVDMSRFPHLKEHIECAADNGNLIKRPEKNKLL